MFDIEKELAAYEKTDNYVLSFNDFQNYYKNYTDRLPSDDEIRTEILEEYKTHLMNANKCEQVGHIWHEENIDAENGCNDLVCDRCGEMHHIQW